MTALDLARVLGAVATGRAAGAESCAALERVLAGQQHRDQVPAGLPEGTYVAHKTGWVDGVAHDVALVRPDLHPAYVVAICTTAGSSVEKDRLCLLNADLSRLVWEAWTDPDREG